MILNDDYLYDAFVDRIIDGDTIDVTIDLGFDVLIKQRLRFARINAPEKRGASKPAGLAAKAALTKKVMLGTKVCIKTSKRGKYGRYITEVYLPSGENVNDWMVTNGYATYTVA